METAMIILWLSVPVAVIAGIVLYARRTAARRREALEAAAQQAGWSFSADPADPETLGVGAFPLFTYGRRGRAYNVSRVTAGSALTLFDYSYTVGSGKHQHTVTQTVVHVAVPHRSLPPFVLSPEGVVHKIGGLFGYHDIDFDASPEFSKNYLLRSKEDEPRVRDLFHPGVRAWFEQRAPLTVESAEGGVLVYRQGRTVAAEALRTFVDDAAAVAAQFAS